MAYISLRTAASCGTPRLIRRTELNWICNFFPIQNPQTMDDKFFFGVFNLKTVVSLYTAIPSNHQHYRCQKNTKYDCQSRKMQFDPTDLMSLESVTATGRPCAFCF